MPTPRRQRISVGERWLAAIMAPEDGPSRMHGLHGKKLMFVLPHASAIAAEPSIDMRLAISPAFSCRSASSCLVTTKASCRASSRS